MQVADQRARLGTHTWAQNLDGFLRLFEPFLLTFPPLGAVAVVTFPRCSPVDVVDGNTNCNRKGNRDVVVQVWVVVPAAGEGSDMQARCGRLGARVGAWPMGRQG